MIRFMPIFSDNALFQQLSVLTIRGFANPLAALKASILTEYGVCVSSSKATADSDGAFSVALQTPKGSFDRFVIRVADGTETKEIYNVQFGELWISSGQSNMELANHFQPEFEDMMRDIHDMSFRVYFQDCPDIPYSMTEDEDLPTSRWVLCDNVETLKNVSACATSFAKALSAFFEKRAISVPIGILNVSWWGTPIRAWIPLNVMQSDPICRAEMEKEGRFPIAEKWNTFGENNYSQPSAIYNRRLGPLRGIKARGIIWYQGESDIDCEFEKRVYSHYLKLFRSYLEEKFSPGDQSFFMIVSMLYPYDNSDDGGTGLGYLNHAIVQTALQDPKHFACCPICDLPPSYDTGYWTIHPNNKYPIGVRMAKLAMSNVYGGDGPKRAATLRSYEIVGDQICLRFDDVADGLFIRGDHAVGLYVAGEDGLYMPAQCLITAPDTLLVWYPHLAHPKHCVYAFSSFLPEGNLFAGDFPVTPFATNVDDSMQCIKIWSKPFLDLGCNSVWQHRGNTVGYYPIWKPLFDCDVCLDDVFVEKTEGLRSSVRIVGNTDTIGAYIRSAPYYPLDLYHYSSLELDLYYFGKMECTLVLVGANQETVCRIELRKTDGAPYRFQRYTADLSCLDETIVDTLQFVFHIENDDKEYFVNIGRIVLKPKNI
ncbi:MAG: hypothetical protein IJC98_04880 [Clostridia bacterium]|nr:hypothetical protein [Clostridia bacterium]